MSLYFLPSVVAAVEQSEFRSDGIKTSAQSCVFTHFPPLLVHLAQYCFQSFLLKHFFFIQRATFVFLKRLALFWCVYVADELISCFFPLMCLVCVLDPSPACLPG